MSLHVQCLKNKKLNIRSGRLKSPEVRTLRLSHWRERTTALRSHAMSLLRSILIGSQALLCCSCEDQVTIKKQTAELHRLHEEKRLLQTERDRQNQSLAGCEEKLRKAEEDIKTLKKALSQKNNAEEKNIDKKPNVKHKKKGQR